MAWAAWMTGRLAYVDTTLVRPSLSSATSRSGLVVTRVRFLLSELELGGVSAGGAVWLR